VSSVVAVTSASADVVFVVDSTGDGSDGTAADGVCDDGSGSCTLRAAIEQANATPGTDEIHFGILGPGPHTIAPTSVLPTITDPLVIDGTTEPDFVNCSEGPVIELDGTGVGGADDRDGLKISAGSSTVRGLVVNNFSWPGAGIDLETAGGNTVECNYLGTSLDGATAAGNARGIVLDSPSNVVGGSASSARNVISGNELEGVRVDDPSNIIQGNFIGTNASGDAALGTGLGQASSGIFVNGQTGTVIGGSGPGEGNLIAGNGSDGIALNGSGSLVQGNLIGLSANGAAAVANGGDGLRLGSSTTGNMIGGTSGGARNIISGNDGFGISLRSAGSASLGNLIQGNYIGVGIDGITPLGNVDGGIEMVQLGTFGARNESIGGTAPGAGNLISGNLGPGIVVSGNDSTRNPIRGNAILNNAGLAIDIGNDGVTPNDTDDQDTGANNVQNFPVLDTAAATGGTTEVDGSLNSEAARTYRVEFFSSPACDSSGFGEGATFLGASNVTTDGDGDVSFTVALTAATSAGEVVTATATGPDGNTSEFSACATVSDDDVGYTIVSRSDSGAQVTTNPHQPFGTRHVSDDGRFVVFSSDEQLASDSNAHQDVFVRDTILNETELVSVSSAGAQGNAGSGNPSISADGRYVLFSSSASTLLPSGEDTNGQFDLFVRDRLNDSTERVNLTMSGGQAAFGVRGGAQMSADGRYIVFCSQSTDMINTPSGDVNGSSGDIFVRDTVDDTTSLVSVNSAGQQGTSFSWENPSISSNGRFVTFRSISPNFVTPTESDFDDDFFRHDLITGETIRVNETANGQRFHVGTNTMSVISDNGRYVVLQTSINGVLPEDRDNAYDVYVRDLELGTLVRVGQPTVGAFWNGTGNGAQDAITPNGRFIVFSSGNQLITNPNDPNAHEDLFIRDLYTGEFEYVCATPNVLVQGRACFSPSISSSGRFLTFRSGANDLATPDTNNVDDIFLYKRGAAGPMDAPGVPWNVRATSGDGEASVTWDPPLFEGASPIDSYTVTASPGSAITTVGAGTTAATIAGLDNGTAYRFTVKAQNGQGSGAESGPSSEIVPGTPGAPTNVQATGGPQEATVTWDPPASTGASPITSYTVTSSPHGVSTSVGAGSSSAVVSGLQGGTTYTFTVVATNAFGSGPSSDPSNAVVTSSIPFDAPTNVNATAGDGEATVTWDAPVNTGGSQIDFYEIYDSTFSVDEIVDGSETSVVLSDLTNGTSYTFRVIAYNTNGNSSPPSESSNAVTPAPPVPPADLEVTTTVQSIPTYAGHDLAHTVQVKNLGPNSAMDTTLSDVLPTGAVFASVVTDRGSCTHSAGTVSCALGDLANTQTATITIVTTPTVAGTTTFSATASTTATDNEPDNDEDSSTLVVGGQTCTIVGTQVANPSLVGTSGSDVICGLGGNDQISGVDGADVLVGGSGNDNLLGGNHDDWLIGGAGNDGLNGGSGTDLARFDASPAAVTASIGTLSATGEGSDGMASGSIEGLVGSSFSDTLSGNNNNQSLAGLGGNDSLNGSGGNDILQGGGQSDTLNGGGGDDWLYGQAGDDIIDGGAGGKDLARYDDAPGPVTASLTTLTATGDGSDTFVTNSLEGLVGSPYDDDFTGGSGADGLYPLGGNDLVRGQAGADRLEGGEGDDSIVAGPGNDTLLGLAGNDVFDGGDGTDTVTYAFATGPVMANLTSLAANGEGSDTFVASTVENLIGSPFGDSLTGDGLNNRLEGVDGNDSLVGLAGVDTLLGGNGNDTLDGGAGNDTLNGGAGTDSCTQGGGGGQVSSCNP
jgi:CSLREA domain-containing protein/uncharacterized repeat protein (TIGR01451 family)